jgi:hypothetical protein
VNQTPFTRLCETFGWSSPSVFRQMYAATAARLGEPPEISARQFQRWRDPDPPCPQPGRQRVLEAMLGVPLEQAGFRVPEHRRNVVPAVPLTDPVRTAPHDRIDDVNRRAFLALTGVSALATAIPADTAPVDTPKLGTDAVADLRAGLASLYGLDDRFGGTTVGPLAAAHLSRVERLIATTNYPETIGRQLKLIAGETAEHIAWLAFDAGNHPRARTYWKKAQRHAEDLHDDSLHVVVMASMSLLNLRENAPRAALDLAQGAQEKAKAWAPPSLLSILTTREARALAALDDHTTARSTLAHAARLYEQDQGSRPAPDWTLFHGPAEIAHAQAALFTAIGHHHGAVTWLRNSLTRQEATYARNEALGRFTLASSLAQGGEADEAAHELTQGAALLTEVSSGRARTLMDEAHRHLAQIDPCRAEQTAHFLTA